MKIMMLYGVNCTKKIWSKLTPYLNRFDVDYVEYPHSVTTNAKKVDDITNWVYTQYGMKNYDAIIGHSLGGIIALQLVAKYKMKIKKIIYIDTNLKPANEFYKNLMTPAHMEQYGDEIVNMFNDERKYYTPELFKSLQEGFDYTDLLFNINSKVSAIYGDRNQPNYENKIVDLNLSSVALSKINLEFIHNACHMIMIENPEDLGILINKILEE